MKIKENIKQLFLYLLVGAVATAAEWIIFHLLDEKASFHYMAATALAFIISTFVNWAVGKMLLFRSGNGIFKELLQIYMTSVAGLLMNLLIMFVLVEKFSMGEMISKMAATGIVFFWNFLIRKLVIYKI